MRRKDAELRTQRDTIIQIRELVIHPGRHEVKLQGESINLTMSALLQFLAKRPGWAYSK